MIGNDLKSISRAKKKLYKHYAPNIKQYYI